MSAFSLAVIPRFEEIDRISDRRNGPRTDLPIVMKRTMDVMVFISTFPTSKLTTGLKTRGKFLN